MSIQLRLVRVPLPPSLKVTAVVYELLNADAIKWKYYVRLYFTSEYGTSELTVHRLSTVVGSCSKPYFSGSVSFRLFLVILNQSNLPR